MTSNTPALIGVNTTCQVLFGNDDAATRMRLYRMIKRDEISATKYGTRWWIQRHEVERIAGSSFGSDND